MIFLVLVTLSNLHVLPCSEQLISLYGGPVEFFFIVESEEDAAYSAASQLLKELQVSPKLKGFKIF